MGKAKPCGHNKFLRLLPYSTLHYNTQIILLSIEYNLQFVIRWALHLSSQPKFIIFHIKGKLTGLCPTAFHICMPHTAWHAVEEVVWKVNGGKKQNHVYCNQKNRKTLMLEIPKMPGNSQITSLCRCAFKCISYPFRKIKVRR